MFALRSPHSSLLRHRFRPTLEGLEDRCTPANVTAIVQNGVLHLTADQANSADEIEIDESSDGVPGHLDITGKNGTTINNTGAWVAKGVRSIVFDLKGGDDEADFEADIAGSLVFNGGGGANTLSLGFNCIVGGSVRYLNGSQSANFDGLYISFGSVIGRNVLADFGKGESTLVMSDATVGGKVSVKSLGGDDSVEISDTVIAGALIANLGNGANSVSIDALGDSTGGLDGGMIGGKLAITTGKGADNILLGDENPLTVAGKVTIVSGDEPAGIGDLVKIDDTEFLDSVFIDLGGGDDVALFEFIDTTSPSYTTIAGTLTILGRGGDDGVFFGAATGSRKVEMAKQPVIKLGGGSNTLTLTKYSINGVDQAPLV